MQLALQLVTLRLELVIEPRRVVGRCGYQLLLLILRMKTANDRIF